MKREGKLAAPLNSRIIRHYLFNYLLPLVIGITVTLLSVRFVNDFIRSQNERFSDTIVTQLSQDLNDLIDETEQIAIAYSTNLSFFKQLESILSSDTIKLSQLETLRMLEQNVTITQSIRPYIASIYFCPENIESGSFLVAQDGIAYFRTHFDADFILQAMDEAFSGLVLRNVKENTPLQTSYLTYVAHTSKSMISSVAGSVVINMDARMIQNVLQNYTKERTDDLFMVLYGDQQLLFGSEPLLNTEFSREKEGIKLNGSEYILTAEKTDARGFTYQIFATHTSLYASGNLLIVINLLVMLCFLVLGMIVVWHISKDRYRDYVRAGDFVRKLDDIGSRIMGKEMYQARYEEMQNYIQLHLSEKELKERTLELETLRHQLNPHMLMNTLQTINWRLIREFGGHTDVNVSIENLSKILSYTLYPADSLAAMEEEIQYTNSYIALQSHNFPQTIAVEWHIHADSQALRVPRLIFQPIIENAYKYAFTKSYQNPRIWIDVYREDDGVNFVVSDNGIGMKEETLLAVRKKLTEAPKENSGIGLYNIHKRIQLLFGSRYGIRIESEWGKGTRVSIKLPAVTDQ